MNTVPRDKIVSLLMQKINASEVIIRLGSVTIVPLIRAPVFVATEPTSYPTSNDSKDNNSLSSGAAAGLTVAVFIIGVIVGVISALITCGIMRSTKTGRFSMSTYNKQRDDVVI